MVDGARLRYFLAFGSTAMAGQSLSPTGQAMWSAGPNWPRLTSRKQPVHMNSLAFLGVHAVGGLGPRASGDLDLFLVLLVVGRRDPVLQDGVQIGLDVVGVDDLLVLLDLVVARRLLAGPGGGLGHDRVDLDLDDHVGVGVEHLVVAVDQDVLVRGVLIEGVLVERVLVQIDLEVLVELVTSSITSSSAMTSLGSVARWPVRNRPGRRQR